MNLRYALDRFNEIPYLNLRERLWASKLGGSDSIAERFIEKLASGYPVILPDSIGTALVDYKIYGNSVQDGTPTPEEPVEVQSVGNPVYAVLKDSKGNTLYDSDSNELHSNDISGYEIPIVCRGKNLFDKNGDQVAGYIDYTGNIHDNLGWMTFTDYIKCTDNISLRADNGLGTSAFIRCYDKNGTYIGVVSQGRNNAPNISLELPTGTRYIQTCCRTNNLDSYQIELGNTATEYEPYKEPIRTTITLDEPLRKIGDYTDRIDFANRCVVRDIGEKVFDGTEDFKPHKELKGWFQLPYGKIYVGQLSFCTNFSYHGNPSVMSYGQFTTVDPINNSGRFVFKMSENMTLGEFKDFLASEYEKSTPVTVYYPLADPITTPITLQSLPTFDQSTIIEVDTDPEPSGIEVTYKAKGGA